MVFITPSNIGTEAVPNKKNPPKTVISRIGTRRVKCVTRAYSKRRLVSLVL